MTVPIEDRDNGATAGTNRDLFRTGPSGNPKGDSSVPEIMRTQMLKAGFLDGRLPNPVSPVRQSRWIALGRTEHEIVPVGGNSLTSRPIRLRRSAGKPDWRNPSQGLVKVGHQKEVLAGPEEHAAKRLPNARSAIPVNRLVGSIRFVRRASPSRNGVMERL